MKNLQHLFFLGFFCLLSCNVFSNVDSKVDEKKPVNRKRKNYSTKKIGGAFLASGTCALLGYAFWPKKNAEKENNNPPQFYDLPSANPDANNVDENQAQDEFFSKIEKSSRAFYSKIQSIDFKSSDQKIELNTFQGFMTGFGLPYENFKEYKSDFQKFFKQFASVILKKYFTETTELSDDAVLFVSVFANLYSLFYSTKGLHLTLANGFFTPISDFIYLEQSNTDIFRNVDLSVQDWPMRSSALSFSDINKNILQQHFDQAKNMLTKMANSKI